MSGQRYVEAADQTARWVAANRSEPGPVLYEGTPGEALFLQEPGDVDLLVAMLDDPAVEMEAGLFTGAAGIGQRLSWPWSPFVWLRGRRGSGAPAAERAAR